MVIEKGKIVEVGNHQQLLSQNPNGVYAGFVRQQGSAVNEPADGEDSDNEAVEIEDVTFSMKRQMSEKENSIKQKVGIADKKLEEKMKTKEYGYMAILKRL